MKNIIGEFYAVQKTADTAVRSKYKGLAMTMVSSELWEPDMYDVLDDLVWNILAAAGE